MQPGEVRDAGPGERFTCIQSGLNGEPFIFELELAPRIKGPPMHTHPHLDEHLEVLSGTIVFRVGRTVHRLGPGDQLTLPRSPAHTFYNPSKTEPVRCRVVHGATLERASAQPDFTRLAIYLVHEDPEGTVMASPFVRGLLRLVAWFGRLRGVRVVT